MIDLRSDTVTRPTPAMREVMARAEVGDDVYGDDPTVIELQERAAALFNKETALFLPTGTQSNLAAVMAHCDRGDEYLIGDRYHILCHEAGGTAVLGSVLPCPLPTAADGAVSPDDIREAVKTDDPHFARTRLLCLENTVSGLSIPLSRMVAAASAAREFGLHVHLDGARILNATVAQNITPARAAAYADTVSVCLSKGLGAPAGTVLCGPKELIARAHRMRKMLGGAMRQAGVLAACGIHALEHHIARLAEDHRRARLLADRLQGIGGLKVPLALVQTNMVFLDIEPADAEPLHRALFRNGILASIRAPRSRLVVHLDIGDADIGKVADSIIAYFEHRDAA
ncbi:MAG: low-specificity L-threonine aldolase [Geminicoccaceae bacterium]|nr:low-specificity L-threonine aldolase [Geminicoccaceae bacterium]